MRCRRIRSTGKVTEHEEALAELLAVKRLISLDVDRGQRRNVPRGGPAARPSSAQLQSSRYYETVAALPLIRGDQHG